MSKIVILKYDPETAAPGMPEQPFDLYGYLLNELDNAHIETEIVEHLTDPVEMLKAELARVVGALSDSAVALEAAGDGAANQARVAREAATRGQNMLDNCKPIEREYVHMAEVLGAAQHAQAFLNMLASASVDGNPAFHDRLREPRKRLAIALSKAEGKLLLGDLRDELEITRAAGFQPRPHLTNEQEAAPDEEDGPARAHP